MNKQQVIDNLYNQLKIIADEAKGVIMAVLSSDKGINTKVGTNTLVNSDLYGSLGNDVESLEVIKLLVNDYIDYIESGRSPGSWPPPNVIAAWCQKKGIPSDNQTVFLICRSIYENGIPERPIFDGNDGVWEIIDRLWNDWAEVIFNTIADGLNEDFTNKN